MGQNASIDDAAVPATMKRLVLAAPGTSREDVRLEVQEVPVPQPGSNEVLIKVSAAPVNPSDYGAWTRESPANCPKAIGNEGCGVVVASGGGLLNRLTLGSKVGFTNLENGQGSYSEYVVANALKGAFPIPDDVPIQDAASFFVNPFTAVGILSTVRDEGSKAFVHTAAASQLGQMIVKLAIEDGDLTVVNVVRREEQAKLLLDIGAEHVIVTEENDTWKEDLRAVMKETGARVAFDAISGEMSGTLCDLLPSKGSLYVYGSLGGPIRGIDPVDLIYRNKKVSGWLLPRWLLELRLGGMARVLWRIQSTNNRVASGLVGGWSSTTFRDTTLGKMQEDFLEMMQEGFTGAKLRIRFDAGE